ncbi:hypothetical protein [Thermocoleostomius sinensis]|uniref:Uncharacterized protein n=1 Tax=Thermocoleostomius sinensis A174 TaxID=2016057 RepID=A0A9E8ZCP4_9CYAN|nr:hypothetical protein [Thermocoleostomius sinensis]WAL60835.1 hypothetical protein OXH18_02225 [Thermocoleostomius sinensis A174]
MGKATKPPVRVKLLITNSPRRSPRWSWLWTWGVMGSSIVTTLGGIWIGLRLIVNPGTVSWLHLFGPDWQQSPLTRNNLHTLSEVQAEASAHGLTVGQPVHISTFPGFAKQAAGFNDFLLPLYAEATCRAVDRSIQACPMVELRVYRPTETLRLPGQEMMFEFIDRLFVSGPEELVAIAPLVNANLASAGSTRRLPLHTITPLTGQAPLPGIWFHLSGDWHRGSSRVLYGQLVRYDPDQRHLQSLLAWTSPAQQFPQWQQVTGGEPTELLVNQTIGLEPGFQVYQFAALSSPGKPIQVKAIDLKAAGLKSASYVNGLLLARNGLWSDGLNRLQTAKQTDPDWSDLAQSQLDLVSLHANITRKQAQQAWDSPRSQILALLIDGQWAEAFSVLHNAHRNGYAISTLLANPSDRLWQRVEAAMREEAGSDVLNWGILLSALRHDRDAALAWRQAQANTKGDRPIAAVLALLDPLVTTVESTQLSPSVRSTTAKTLASTSAAIESGSAMSDPVHRLIGSARWQPSINPSDWMRPDSTQALTVAADQGWYEISAIGIQDGADWRSLKLVSKEGTESNLVTQLWSQLQLDTRPTLQLLAWTGNMQPHLRQVTVKGLRTVGSDVVLLAAGDPPPVNPDSPLFLVLTLDTMPWIDPIDRLTVADLSQQPNWSDTLAPMLWQELHHAQSLFLAEPTNPTMLLQQIGGWSVQLMELTGDDQPEAILSLRMKSSSTSPAMQPQTLILSNQGRVLFRDRVLATGPSLKAIVDLGDGPALIMGDVQGYWIERWSAATQQFQSQ